MILGVRRPAGSHSFASPVHRIVLSDRLLLWHLSSYFNPFCGMSLLISTLVACGRTLVPHPCMTQNIYLREKTHEQPTTQQSHAKTCSDPAACCRTYLPPPTQSCFNIAIFSGAFCFTPRTRWPHLLQDFPNETIKARLLCRCQGCRCMCQEEGHPSKMQLPSTACFPKVWFELASIKSRLTACGLFR